MKLLRLEIYHFGKLSDYKLDLQDGLNVLCEERLGQEHTGGLSQSHAVRSARKPKTRS